MTKIEFLESLRDQLKNIPKEQIDEILQDYRDHINIGIEKGRNEEELIKSLGDPREIAKQMNANYSIKNAEEKTSARNIFRALYATAGLGFFNLIFVLPLFIIILVLLVVLFAVPLSLIFAGIIVIIANVGNFLAPDYFFKNYEVAISVPEAVGTSLISIGLISMGLLILIAAYYVTKPVFKLVLRYLKFNLNIIQNKEESL